MTPTELICFKMLVSGFITSVLLFGLHKLSYLMLLPNRFRYNLLKWGHLSIYIVPLAYLLPKFSFNNLHPIDLKPTQLLLIHISQIMPSADTYLAQSASTFSVSILLLGIYGCIALLKILNLLRRYSRTKTLLADVEEVNSFGIRVHLSDNIATPITFGLLPSLVYLPKKLYENLLPMKLQAIVRHEQIHVERADFLFKFSTLLQECIWFFNPFARFLSDAAELEMEITCDERVIKDNLISKKEYGSILIKLSTDATCGELVAMGATTSIKGRIKAMKENKKPNLLAQGLITFCLLISVVTFSVFALASKSKDITLNYGVTVVTKESKEAQKSSLNLNYGEESVSQVGDVAIHIAVERGSTSDQIIFKFVEVSSGKTLRETAVPFVDHAGLQVVFPNQEVQKIAVKLSRKS